MSAHSPQTEADKNYEAYKRELPKLMTTAPGKFVVMHDEKVVETFDTFRDAVKFGNGKFGTEKFSVQEVTSEKINLGFHSYALYPHIA